jgi:hypothetical protein
MKPKDLVALQVACASVLLLASPKWSGSAGISKDEQKITFEILSKNIHPADLERVRSAFAAIGFFGRADKACPTTTGDVDLRALDWHRGAAVTALTPALSCRSCRPIVSIAGTGGTPIRAGT